MTDSRKFICLTGTSFVITSALTVAYWIELHNLTGTCYGGPYYWARFSQYYLLASSILLLTILLLNQAWKNNSSKLKKTILFLLAAPNLGTIIYVTGTFVSYVFQDQCEGLRDLIQVTFWISIAICASPFIFISLLFLSGGVKAIKAFFASSDPQDHYPMTNYRAVPEVNVHPNY